MRPDSKPRVVKVVQEHLGVDADKTGDATTLDELGADSLDIVELEMAFEEHFDFRFPKDDGMLNVDMTIDQVVGIVDEARTDD